VASQSEAGESHKFFIRNPQRSVDPKIGTGGDANNPRNAWSPAVL